MLEAGYQQRHGCVCRMLHYQHQWHWVNRATGHSGVRLTQSRCKPMNYTGHYRFNTIMHTKSITARAEYQVHLHVLLHIHDIHVHVHCILIMSWHNQRDDRLKVWCEGASNGKAVTLWRLITWHIMNVHCTCRCLCRWEGGAVLRAIPHVTMKKHQRRAQWRGV